MLLYAQAADPESRASRHATRHLEPSLGCGLRVEPAHGTRCVYFLPVFYFLFKFLLFSAFSLIRWVTISHEAKPLSALTKIIQHSQQIFYRFNRRVHPSQADITARISLKPRVFMKH